MTEGPESHLTEAQSLDLHPDAEFRVTELIPLIKALLDVADSQMPMDSKIVITRTLAAVLRGDDPLAVNVSAERKASVVTAIRHCAIAWSYAIEAQQKSGEDARRTVMARFNVGEDAVKKAFRLYGEIGRNLAAFVEESPELKIDRTEKLLELTRVIWVAFPYKDLLRQATE